MSEKRYDVRVIHTEKSQDYTGDFQVQEKFAIGWKAVLQKAYKTAEIRCLCFGKGEKRLSVSHLSSANSYYLSRFPHTGPEHANDCIYYAPDATKSGLSSYSKGVIEELPAGGLKIKLGFVLDKKDPAIDPVPNKSIREPQGERVFKPSMKLRGLLHLLWSEAGLCKWTPAMANKRKLGVVHHYLIEAASRIQVGRQKLNDVLLVATQNEKGQQAKANAEKTTFAKELNRRLVVIAPLASHTQQREDGEANLVPIAGFHGIPRMRVDNEKWAKALVRFHLDVAAWRRGSRVLAIIQTDPPSNESNTMKVLDIALMQVSSEWIPVESNYEAIIEKRLRDQGRRFYKPMCYDAADDVVFPDFWIVDTEHGHDVPMEVFGRNDEKYLIRKREKFDYYNREYKVSGWWYWDAAIDPKGMYIPAFPKPKLLD
ncbi:DUF1173 family protein [Eoetvoesiella caeni]